MYIYNGTSQCYQLGQMYIFWTGYEKEDIGLHHRGRKPMMGKEMYHIGILQAFAVHAVTYCTYTHSTKGYD